MVTKAAFVGIVGLLALQRLFELRLSRRNEARILVQGGREHSAGHFKSMKVLHTSWFLGMLGEVLWLDRPFMPKLAVGALIVTVVGQSLRYAAILTLGWRWTVRVMTLPDSPPVDRGIYRYLRHPNYLGVILEIAAVPLLHSAYLTAVFYTIANAWLLATRIRAEEKALSLDNNFAQIFAGRPRFIPRRPAR